MNPEDPRPQLELLPPAAYPPPPLLPAPPPQVHRLHPLRAALLFAATFFTTTTMGAVFQLDGGSVPADLGWLQAVALVWSDPALLRPGLLYACAVLTILLIHELGHSIACHRYRLPATLPYFLPFPFALGTLGAFIRIKAPLRSKRELFDIGVAGPLAGFIALLPFLAYGIAHSEISPLPPADELPDDVLSFGRSLLYQFAIWFFHGPVGDQLMIDLHPFALAAWVGLFATALNLLPIGQLDGGHILYAVLGRAQRHLALPMLALLAVGGLFWHGWWLWFVILLVLGFHHPPVWDEQTPLDSRRKLLALAALLVFALTFMPVPLSLGID